MIRPEACLDDSLLNHLDTGSGVSDTRTTVPRP
ncbi:hypothetical protein M6B38_308790 [Iris pallida]|uniref:Uncharacterized protein n=1 Tax=Iris pallida TaxID=29817 RepID=A0AAX6HJ01_IRIPA|nr:hypothetical protein M6B38_308790 [Iris pallida]